MKLSRILILLLVGLMLLAGCGLSPIGPFIPPAFGQPGYPGEQHDIFPCAAVRLLSNVDEISWDTVAGAFQNNNISGAYFPGQFAGTNHQHDGWGYDNAGEAFFSHVTLANAIETYKSGAGAGKLGAWALFASDATNTWESLDFTSFDDIIWGQALENLIPSLHSLWLDTSAGGPVFISSMMTNTSGLDSYSCTRFGDSLFGPLHFIYQVSAIQYYNFVIPAGWIGLPPTEHATPDIIVIVAPNWDSCQIVGDFEERLWAFYYESVFSGVTADTSFSNLHVTTWTTAGGLPITPLSLPYTWKLAERHTDDTLHAVALNKVPDGLDWIYELWYLRRTNAGWLAPIMVDSWSINGLDEGFQDMRLSAQVTTSPSGVMLWTIQYDNLLAIGDVYAYFLTPSVYHNPILINWIQYPDADGTNLDYIELNAPKFWRY